VNGAVSAAEQEELTRHEKLTLTVRQAAELLGISRAFAYELVARHELPSVRLGRRVVIPRKALEQLLEKESTVR
jgi:excisionase family DNA binding protein